MAALLSPCNFPSVIQVFVRRSTAPPIYLWRAVDQHGNVLDILVQSRRNAVAAKRLGRPPRAFAFGDPSPLEVPQQPGRELASADQGPGTGDETLRLGWAGPTFLFAFGSIREHFRPRRHLISAPEWRTEMTNRFGLEPDHYRRGLKDAVSQHLSSPSPLISTAPQPFSNNSTMPARLPRAVRQGCFRPDHPFEPRCLRQTQWAPGPMP